MKDENMFEVVNKNAEKALKRKEKEKQDSEVYIFLPMVERNYYEKHKVRKPKKEKESVLARLFIAMWFIYLTVITTYIFVILTLYVMEKIL
jgi:hypothetical protein